MATGARIAIGLVAALAGLPACIIPSTPASVDGSIDAPPVDARPIDAVPVPPMVTSVAPARGPTTGGIPITVTGSGFAAGVAILVAGRVATVTAVDATTITFTLPAAPGAVGPADVVITNVDGGETTAVGGVRYYYGTLGFAAKVDYPTGAEPRGLVAVDLDGDQDLDVVTVHRSGGTVAVSRNPGTGALAARVAYPFSAGNDTLAVADWSGDGKLDAATVAAGGVAVLIGDGQGGFGAFDPTNPRHFRPLPDAACAAPVDLDGDGRRDLVIGYRNAGRGVGALLGTANGLFALTTTTATTADVAVVAAGRLDGDLHDDVVAGVAGNLLVLRGTAPGLAAPVAYPLGVAGAPAQLAIADLDGDGDRDVVAAVSGGFGLAIFDNLGNGTFGPVTNLATAGNASLGVAAVDLDLDGLADLVISNRDADTVTVRRGLGAGSYGPGVDLAVGDRPEEVFVVDLDRDGKLDLVVQNDTSGDFSVLRGTPQ